MGKYSKRCKFLGKKTRIKKGYELYCIIAGNKYCPKCHYYGTDGLHLPFFGIYPHTCLSTARSQLRRRPIVFRTRLNQSQVYRPERADDTIPILWSKIPTSGIFSVYGRSMTAFPNRIFRAMKLDATLYKEVGADEGAMGQGCKSQPLVSQKFPTVFHGFRLPGLN